MRKIIFYALIAYGVTFYLPQTQSWQTIRALLPGKEIAASTQGPWTGSTASRVLPANAGIVTQILPDDTVGRRHQKFILKLSSGNTVLIAHNIDIAPRIAELKEGDVVEFNGVFEMNKNGGVVHWTHHDPSGKRAGGWLKHNGRFYK